jgi:hypothetical protein
MDDGSAALARPHRAPTDGWLGTPELPGYRAGNIVAKLEDLPQVDPEHLYLDLLLLDADGALQDSLSGPCRALPRTRPNDERSRFVRVLAELLRHVPDDARGLSMVGQAVGLLRHGGIGQDRLVLAAQLLDEACHESAVVASVVYMLELSLGTDEAQRVLAEVVADIARHPRRAHAGRALAMALCGTDEAARASSDEADRVNAAGLPAQVAFVARSVGKAHVRRRLRDATEFSLVPTPELIGLG